MQLEKKTRRQGDKEKGMKQTAADKQLVLPATCEAKLDSGLESLVSSGMNPSFGGAISGWLKSES